MNHAATLAAILIALEKQEITGKEAQRMTAAATKKANEFDTNSTPSIHHP